MKQNSFKLLDQDMNVPATRLHPVRDQESWSRWRIALNEQLCGDTSSSARGDTWSKHNWAYTCSNIKSKVWKKNTQGLLCKNDIYDYYYDCPNRNYYNKLFQLFDIYCLLLLLLLLLL